MSYNNPSSKHRASRRKLERLKRPNKDRKLKTDKSKKYKLTWEGE